MKKYFLVLLLLLNYFSVYSQLRSKWRIIKYKPEEESFSKSDEAILRREVIGKILFLDSFSIRYPRNSLKGSFTKKINTIKIIEDIDIPDSSRYLLRYFCQEVYNLGAITRQTINYLDPHFKAKSIKIYTFKCKEDGVIDCVDIFVLNKNKYGFCIAGDGLFLAERVL